VTLVNDMGNVPGRNMRLASLARPARKARMPAAPAHKDRRGRAIAYRVGSATGFALMAAMIKVAADDGIAVVEIMFWRFAFGLLPLFAFMALGPGARVIRTQRFGAHLWRSAIGLVSMYLSFRALAALPLAEATTISFAAPLFAIAMSALLLGERVGPRRWSAVAVGFLGVVIVADPGGERIPTAGLLFAVGGAIGVAAVTIAIRRIGRTEASETTVFWFSALSLTVLAVPTLQAATPHDAREWMLLLCIGLTGGVAQLFMTGSLRLAPVSVIAPFDYSQLIWAVLLGWAIWNTAPTPQTWLGATIIAACGLYSAYRERKLQQLAAVANVPSYRS